MHSSSGTTQVLVFFLVVALVERVSCLTVAFAVAAWDIICDDRHSFRRRPVDTFLPHACRQPAL